VFRAVAGEQVVRWITVEDEGEPVNLFAASASARKPSGAIAVCTASIEDPAEDGIIRLTIASSTLNEVGKWMIEVVANGEHVEEPIPLQVRSEYERGPR